MTRILVVLALVLAVTPAVAEPPWYRGVAKDKQKAAYDLFKEGNTHFEQNEYAKAAELYVKALAIWDHPGIHFNLAVSLVNLDRNVDAMKHMDAAMKYGLAGLESQTRFKEAQTYRRLLEGRIVTFTVTATQSQVEITLDGKKLAPNTTVVIEPGPHALVATKIGFETITRNLTLVGGKITENIVFSPRQRRMKVVRYFRPWVPWAVVATGAAVGLVGSGVVTIARSHRGQFESEFATACPDGCVFEDPSKNVTWNLRDRSKTEYWIGFGAAAAGAVALTTGLVMVALNGLREVEIGPGTIAVVPSTHGGGVHWLARF